MGTPLGRVSVKISRFSRGTVAKLRKLVLDFAFYIRISPTVCFTPFVGTFQELFSQK
jgi:hypothetical protein